MNDEGTCGRRTGKMDNKHTNREEALRRTPGLRATGARVEPSYAHGLNAAPFMPRDEAVRP